MRLAIVIPAFNEESRLPETLHHLKLLSRQPDFPWALRAVVVVNDGSTDQTSGRVMEMAVDWPELSELRLQRNLGKGAAVYTGLRHLHASSDVEFILVADADEATPWRELWRLVEEVKLHPGSDLYYASRRHPQSQILQRQAWWRESMGRGFNLLLRLLAGISVKDTQCGFKLFRNHQNLSRILEDWSVARFAWDAEVFLSCSRLGFHTQEFSVGWRHVEASRVHPIRDSLQMAWEILRLRMKRSVIQRSLAVLKPARTSAERFSERVNSELIR